MKATLKVNGQEKELTCFLCNNNEFDKHIVKVSIANMQYSCGREYQNGYKDEKTIKLICKKCGFIHEFGNEFVNEVSEIDDDVIIGDIEEC